MYLASLLSRSLRRFAPASLALFAFSPAALLGQGNSAADGYDPNVDGNVYALATQADGKLIVGGAFSSLQPNGATGQLPRSNLARLNSDGIPDSFSPNANGAVNAVAVQSDGKIIVGGAFTSLQPGGATSVARNRIARLNADGTVDAAFNPNLGDQFSDVQVYAVAVQLDGKIVVGGTFVSTKPGGVDTGLPRNRLLRLNANGSLDTDFNPGPNNAVFAIAIMSDQRILVGGSFTSFADGTVRNRIARLNSNGTLDTSFDPNANGTVNSLGFWGGKIMVGGSFTTLQPAGAASALTRSCIARLNLDGSIDSAFNGGANGQVSTFASQGGGKLLVGGQFTSLFPAEGSGRTETRQFIGRFNADGSLDPAFIPSPNSSAGYVRAIVAQSDGSIVFGGYFTQIRPPNAPFGTPRNHIARVYPDGTPDVSLDLGAGGGVLAVTQQPADGKFLIGGTFTTVGGTTHNYIARLNANGTLDSTFNATLNNHVNAIAVQSNKQILVAGSFTTANGAARNFLARLNEDGSLDTAFDPSPNNFVNTFAIQKDGKIIIGGAFTALTPNAGTTATVRTYLARLNTDGTVDSGYSAVANQPVQALKFQSDDKLIVAGQFTAIQPQGALVFTGRNGIARLNTDGTLDTAYNPNPNGATNTIAIQGDGKVVAGGSFTAVFPNNTGSIATRNRIARFNTDGTVDTFDPNANGFVGAVAVQSDGKVLISGGLTALGTNTIPGFGRVNSDGSFDANFHPNPNGRVLALFPLPDGNTVLGGTFSTFQPNTSALPIVVSRIVRWLNATGTVDTNFNPGVSGQDNKQVIAVALQQDGKILLGGNFTDLGGTSGSSLARFFPDGVPDLTFSPAADGAVNAILVRPDVGAVGTQGNGFAWINSAGNLLPGFGTDANARFVGEVKAVARQLDGKVLVGGVFSNSSGVTGSNLARFLSNGALDTSFNPNPNGTVTTIVVQPDGKVLIGGAFTSIAGVTRNHIARFNTDSTLDSFDPNASSVVDTIVLNQAPGQAPFDSKIYIGGGFTALQPNGTTTVTTRSNLARLNADGTVDTAFNAAPSGEIFSIAVQPDQKVIFGGSFISVLGTGDTVGTIRYSIARVDSGGKVDSFDPNHGVASGPIFAIVVQPDTNILVGGSFGAIGGVARSNIARLVSDGSLDSAYTISANGQVNALALQGNGQILVGGAFNTIAGGTRNHLARLNSNGSLDTSFNPNVNNQVGAISLQGDGSILLGGSFNALQPGGSIVVGGSFANIGGGAVSNLALLNNDGTANTAFKPNPNGAVNATVVQGDGKYVVGGAFTTFTTAGTARNRIARFNLDGTLDAAYNPNLNGAVRALALQSDGKVLVGGEFTTVGAAARSNLARLNTDGSLDGSFNPAVLALPVQAIAVQADGKIIAVTDTGGTSSLSRLNADGSADGAFATTANGLIRSVTIQADGKILVGGAFTTIRGVSRSRIARLNVDGTVDSALKPEVDNTVNALALQQDGKVVLGGAFSSVSEGTSPSLPRVRVARISNSTAATQGFVQVTSTVVTWVRGGSSPEISTAAVERSTDGRTWTSYGSIAREAGTANWRITLPSSLTDISNALRVRGTVPTTQGGSGGLVEATLYTFVEKTSALSSSPLASASTDRAFLYAVAATDNPTGYSATGLPDGLSIDPATGIISGTPRQTGVFNVTLFVTNSGGTTASTLTLTVNASASAGAPGSGHLLDMSCLARVDADQPLFTGFIISGTEPKSVLLRAVGPGMSYFNLSDKLATPRMQLVAGDGRVLLDNTSWGGSPALAAVFAQAGNFPLSPSSADAAAAVTLAPGGYTIVVTDASGTGGGGMVLAEIYDVAGGAQQFTAMSARGHIISGGSLTSGFVITGDAPRRILVRGVGPALATQGVTDGVPDPVLMIAPIGGQELARNDNWQTPLNGGASAAEISAAFTQVGLYAFANGGKDAALIVTLAPGVYTAQVTANASGSGSAVVEMYELP